MRGVFARSDRTEVEYHFEREREREREAFMGVDEGLAEVGRKRWTRALSATWFNVEFDLHGGGGVLWCGRCVCFFFVMECKILSSWVRI